MNSKLILAFFIWILSSICFAQDINQVFTAEVHSCAKLRSDCLRACAIRGKLSDPRCTNSCLSACTAAASVESCYYNSDTGVCLALKCTGGEAGTWIGQMARREFGDLAPSDPPPQPAVHALRDQAELADEGRVPSILARPRIAFISRR